MEPKCCYLDAILIIRPVMWIHLLMTCCPISEAVAIQSIYLCLWCTGSPGAHLNAWDTPNETHQSLKVSPNTSQKVALVSMYPPDLKWLPYMQVYAHNFWMKHLVMDILAWWSTSWHIGDFHASHISHSTLNIQLCWKVQCKFLCIYCWTIAEICVYRFNQSKSDIPGNRHNTKLIPVKEYLIFWHYRNNFE